MGSETTYDVFLSYTSLDRELVLRIAKELKDRGCSSFLDQWYLKPGFDWVDALERALAASKSVAVFIGPHEMGRWQQRERAWALDRLAEHDDFPVVPVLLPGCEPPLGFMKQLLWIDLRDDPTSASQMDALAAAVRGEPVDLDGRSQPRAMICPYRGLLAFREEDADFFFGRDKYVKQLTDLVKRERLVTVVGASGSGKSSLLSAGLVPQLRKQPDGPIWDVVRMVPNVDPLYSLSEALMPFIEPELSGLAFEQKLGELASDLEQQNPRTSVWGLANAVLRNQPGTERLLLFVDQWEEIYTNCENATRRNRFITELLDATSRKDVPLTVVLSVRGDFFGEILQNRHLVDRIQAGRLDLGPMNSSELRSAIEGPAKAVGLRFQNGLVDRILKEAGEEPGRLPLLEFALEELWKRRDGVQLTHTGYEDLGRRTRKKATEVQAANGDCLSQAIATYAEGIYAEMSVEEQESLPGLFRRLVRAGAKTEDDARRRAALGQLDERTRRVARKLADKRLLVTTRSVVGEQAIAEKQRNVDKASTNTDQLTKREEAGTTVEVAHEELLRRWGRLKQWVNEDRQFLLWRSRLDLKIEEYERDGGVALFKGRPLHESKKFYRTRNAELDESQRRFLDASLMSARRRKLSMCAGAGVVLVVLAAIGLSWYRYGQRQSAARLIEGLMAAQPGAVNFYLDELEPYKSLAVPRLREELTNTNRRPAQRLHAAYALARFDEERSDELPILLDGIPTLAADEGENLIRAIETVHVRQPLNEKFSQRLEQVTSDQDRGRYAAVALRMGITDGVNAACDLKQDPSSRTLVIHGFKDFPGDLRRVVDVLEKTEDPNLRSALCLAIGVLGVDAAVETGPALKQLYKEAPDGGTHSAAGWALRQQGLDWEQLPTVPKGGPVESLSWFVNNQDITMVKIPAGTFEMGDEASVYTAEQPAHPVTQSKDFWMSDREVNVGQFSRFVEDQNYDWKAWSSSMESTNDHPVQAVSWQDAVSYCNWLSRQDDLTPYYDEVNWDPLPNANGYRLPTEAEWECACRAGSSSDYCFGNAVELLREYCVYSTYVTTVCGRELPNGWGLFDMHGNVLEWCGDWYGVYAPEPSTDPTGPDQGEYRVLRGGSFNLTNPLELRSAYRRSTSPDSRSLYHGFRVCRTL